MDRIYKNLVFSKHALERLNGRSLTPDAIHHTISSPDKTFHNSDNTKFIRTLNGRRIHAVAAPLENHRWLVISAWVRGEEDQQSLVWLILTAPFKFFWFVLRQFGAFLQKLRK